MENELLKAAMRYMEEYGFSVIPLRPGDKRPIGKWEPFQTERASMEQIVKWWSDYPNANIGLITGALSDLDVIDIDDPKEGMEKLSPYLPEQLETPIVTTPRGGYHYYFRHSKGMTNKAGLIKGTDFRGEGGYVVAPPSKRADGKAYIWLSGYSIHEMPPAPLPIEYINIINISSTVYKGAGIPASLLSPLSNDVISYYAKGRRDDDLFRIANCLIKSGQDISFVRHTLRILAEKCTPPFSLKEVDEKIGSALNRAERKERNLAADVRELINSTGGDINITFIYKTLHILQPTDKQNVSVIMKRLCEEGVLQRLGYGRFRVRERDIIEINPFSTVVSPLDICWPLNVHDFVNTYPKTLIVIAGEPNAGKTAFCLNAAIMNADKFTTTYFSSEMGAMELRVRLEKFKRPTEDWQRIRFIERAGDFADVIDPDGFNIVDFLELHDDFFKVGGLLKQIFDRLNKGLALVALQKPKDRDEGLGGQRGLEKPRLYLAMEPGLLKIVKAKNWRYEDKNPNGMSIPFKLAAGCKFMNTDSWKKAK